MSKDNYISLSNREIRGYARERLLGNLTVPVLTTLILASAKYTFQMCQEFGIIGGGFGSFVFFIVLSLLISTFWGIFKYGISRFYLTLVTKKQADFRSLYAGFRTSTETILTASLVLSLLNLLCLSPFYIYGYFFAPNNLNGLLISVGAFIVCTIISNLVSIIFSPIYYIICDHPGMPFPIVLILNFSMMSIKKWFKFLRLQISFIPLAILSLLSFGIGFLWVLPYVFTSYTYFYEDLCEEYCFLKNTENQSNSGNNTEVSD